MVLFPCEERDHFYEIEGKASFATRYEVEQKWKWWYLFWHPGQEDKFWFSRTGEHSDRVIINVEPVKTRIVHKDNIEFINESHRTIMQKKIAM